MTDKKDSPNSAEIVAQLDASRKGVKAKFCLRFRIASPAASSAAFSEGRLSGPALAKYR